MPIKTLDLPRPADAKAGPYALVGTARAKAGYAEALEKRLLTLVEQTRSEAGALDYHVHRDRADRGLFVFYECWSSVEALEQHLAKPYIQEFLSERMNYLESDMDIRWLDMRSNFA